MARRKSAQPPATLREVREWASANGHTVGARGRVKSEVTDAFTKATGRQIGRVEAPAER